MRRKFNIVMLFSVIILLIAMFSILYAADVPNLSLENNIVSLYGKADKSPYSPGEVVKMNVSIKNIGGKSITFSSLDIGYIVYNSSRMEVHSLGVDVNLVPTTILPQREFELRDLLAWNTTNVAPGNYTIQVILFSPVKAITEIEVEIKNDANQ